MQIFIEFFFIFWQYLAEILFIEKILAFFGVQPDKQGKQGTYLAHVIQIALVLLIIFLTIITYLVFFKYDKINW